MPDQTLDAMKRRAEAANKTARKPDEVLADYARDQRDAASQRAAALLEKADVQRRSLSPAETGQVEDALAAVERWDQRHRTHEARVTASVTRASVLREPLTYEPDSTTSWFKDQWSSRMGDQKAAERLERHGREMEVEQRAREAKARSETRSRGDAYEFRVNPDRPAGFGGSLSPPAWLISKYSLAPRPARILADLVIRYPLPSGAQSVNVPRVVTGDVAQPVNDLVANPNADLTDAVASSGVVTITGHADVSIQALEQSPAGAHLDDVLFADLTAAADAELERQLIAGTGVNGQLLGVQNVTGINSISYTGSFSATGLYPKLGEAFGAVSDNRRVAPECWCFRGGRWAALATGEDEQKRPLATPIDVQSSATVTTNPVGVLLGLPVYLSEGISSTQGTAANQDTVLAVRPSDYLLFESEPHAAVFDEVLSGTMSARIRLHLYVAFIGNRLPSSVSVISGSAMATVTNE